MIGKYFRPWGQIEWILPKLPKVKWDLLSCLSTEDRFDATMLVLKQNDLLYNTLFLKIIDPPSKDSLTLQSKLDVNGDKLRNEPNFTYEIEDHKLLEPYNLIVESVTTFIKKSSGNIIFDISTFPKRFFFPIVRVLLKSNLTNLIVTYSTPEHYCKNELSADPSSWAPIPLFSPAAYPEPEIKLAIVGVGFMPFGLPELLGSKYSSMPVKFLFPFPPGPPNYQRTWDFMWKIQKYFTFKDSDSIIRLNSNNMPDAFAYIVNEANSGAIETIFAPYGPKPVSLAMSIYATLKDSPVYYTQPNYYSPEYSFGHKETFAYCITLNGQSLYSL